MNLRKVLFYSLPFIILGVTIFIIQYQSGFFYYTESNQYIAHYLSDRPILEKLYDFRGHDEGLYRPRELGNVFNMLDAYILAGFAAVGFPHFISVTHIITMIIIASVPLWLVRKRGHDPYLWLAALLLGLLFMLSPVPLLAAYYLRVSKSINAILFMFIFVLLYTARSRLDLRRLLVVGFLTFCLGIIDETGLVSVSILAMYSVSKLIISTYRRNIALLVATMFLSSMMIVLYRNVISPWMVIYSVGITPHLWESKSIVQDPLLLLPYGLQLLVNFFSGLFGGFGNIVTIPIMIGLTIGIGWVTFAYMKRVSQPVWTQRLVLVGWPFFIIVFMLVLCTLLALMINQHPAIMWPELTHSYYQLPFLILAFTLLIIVTFYFLEMPRLRGFVLIGLLLLTITNLIRLPQHYNFYITWSRIQMYDGQAFPVIDLIKQPVINQSQLVNVTSANTVIMMRKILHRPVINDLPVAE